MSGAPRGPSVSSGGAAAVALLRLPGRHGDSFRAELAAVLRAFLAEHSSTRLAAAALAVSPPTLRALCALVNVDPPEGKPGRTPDV